MKCSLCYFFTIFVTIHLLRLTWARPNTFQLGFKCVSGTWFPVRAGSRVSASSGPVDYGSPARVLTERPLTPFCETAVNCDGISLKQGCGTRKIRTKFVIFVALTIFSANLDANVNVC